MSATVIRYEHAQVEPRAAQLGQPQDQPRVVHVALLGHRAHRQVVEHQELDQRRLVGRNAEPRRQRRDHRRALARVTAAAPLADVVQDAAQVEPHRIAYLAHQLGRERQLGAVAAALDPPQLLDQEQRVNVDGVRVVHVLLPHADQVRELRQVGARSPISSMLCSVR